jgi:hypothetical protein
MKQGRSRRWAALHLWAAGTAWFSRRNSFFSHKRLIGPVLHHLRRVAYRLLDSWTSPSAEQNRTACGLPHIGATTVQTCIVHLIRQSPKYVPHRRYEQVVKDLRPIYTAINADAAMRALEAFEEKWGRQLYS